MADTLDNIAANPLHTPALYSGFLRAIISAKVDPPGAAVNGETKAVSQPNNNINSSDNNHNSNSNTNEQTFGTPSEMNLPSSYGLPMNNASDQSYHNEFQFESEMGPVADMSTFPPTMAANPSEDMMGSLTMDNILSSGFWDSVLVPGKYIPLPWLLMSGVLIFLQGTTTWMDSAGASCLVLGAAA